MARPERFQRWRARFGVAPLVCLALFGAGARASNPAVPEAQPVAASAITRQSMPMAAGCMPCALCSIASAPHGTGGGCGAPDKPVWRFATAQVPATVFCDRGVWRTRLPVRIAYCRWLD